MGVLSRIGLAMVAISLTAGRGGAEVSCESLATTCSADCDGNGQVTVAELIVAVGRALGAVESAACAAADFEADGAVTITDLLNGVACALRGPPLALAAGTYDAEVRTVGVDAPPAIGVGSIRLSSGGLSVSVALDPTETFSLFATCTANGAMTLDGRHIVGGDVAIPASGHGRLRDLGTALHFEAVLDQPIIGGSQQVVADLRRPKDPASLPHTDTYRIGFGDSSLLLTIAFAADGTTCGATTHVDLNGDTVGTIGAAEICRVSPSGFIDLYAPYTKLDGNDFFSLQLSGFLSSVGGTFYIAAFPIVDRDGHWTAELIDD